MSYIDEEYVKDWGLEEWKPNRINGHFTLKNILAVEIDTYFIFISIENN